MSLVLAPLDDGLRDALSEQTSVLTLHSTPDPLQLLSSTHQPYRPYPAAAPAPGNMDIDCLVRYLRVQVATDHRISPSLGRSDLCDLQGLV